MKKFHFMRLVLISLLLLSCLVFAACESGNVENNGQAIASISISDSAKPQTVFPQGKDLDLSKGTLTVTYESGRKEDIALNAEGRPIWKPMHLQPIYSKNAFVSACEGGDVGADIFHRGLCLPSDHKMTDEQQDAIIETIGRCFD